MSSFYLSILSILLLRLEKPQSNQIISCYLGKTCSTNQIGFLCLFRYQYNQSNNFFQPRKASQSLQCFQPFLWSRLFCENVSTRCVNTVGCDKSYHISPAMQPISINKAVPKLHLMQQSKVYQIHLSNSFCRRNVWAETILEQGASMRNRAISHKRYNRFQ